MTVHKIAGDDAVGYSEYLASKDHHARRGDYYLGRDGEHGVAPGEWWGCGAAALGLRGDVERGDLLRVWSGRDPRTGVLEVRAGATGQHVAAIDVTFSAPKSVSVVWALARGPEREAIERAQTQAVHVAVDHIERTAPLTRRRTRDGIVHERCGGLIAARFRHHTSRLTAEQQARGEAPDPQLHDHVAIANMALRVGDGSRWAAIDSRELFRIGAEAGAVYRAELADGLLHLGMAVERQGRFIELAGVRPEVRRAFSARTAEVDAARDRFVLEHGRSPHVDEMKRLVVLSRQAKTAECAPAFEQWAQRARDVGIDPERFGGVVRGGSGVAEDREAAVRGVIQELTDPGSAHCVTRTSAVLDERTLRIAVAEAAQGRIAGAEIPAAIEAVTSSGELVRVDDVHWTTRRHLEMEREVVERAMAAAVGGGCPPARETVLAAIGRARVRLTDEQRAAVGTLCGAARFGMLTAPAGTGKGEVLRVVAAAHRSEGHRVIAAAAAGEPSQRLGREIGAHVTVTVEGLLHRVEHGELHLHRTDVVIVDEGALLETTRWHRLLDGVGPATVITAGDGAQLSPIEAGGLWAVLEARIGSVTLTENHRAREPWARDAWAALREGRSMDALRVLEAESRIVVAGTRAQAREAAVAAWDRDRRAGADRGRGIDEYLLVTDASNREVDELNRAAQGRRLAAGELADAAITVVGDDRRGRAREEHIHVGDRVAFVEQVRLAGARRVENGSTGTLVGIDVANRSVRVRLADREVDVPGEGWAALRLGYVQHVYLSQGRTVERVYVVAGGWQTARESTYVGVSRARDSSFVFTDASSLDVRVGDRDAALAELARRTSASRAGIAAVGHAGDASRERAGVGRGGEVAQAGTPRQRWAALLETRRGDDAVPVRDREHERVEQDIPGERQRREVELER